jgi:hypothetical protein
LVAALVSVRFARLSANAAEITERGRRYGWRIEARVSDRPRRFYTLRNGPRRRPQRANNRVNN